MLAPSTLFPRVIRNIYTLLIPNKSNMSNGNKDRLLLVYDTLLNPLTFDFIHTLYYADCQRRRSEKKYFDLLLVSRDDLASSREQNYIDAIGNENLSWRLFNLIVPLSRLFVTVGRIYIVEPQEAFEIVKGYESVHPNGYGYSNPKSSIIRLDLPELTYYPALRVSKSAENIIGSYFSMADIRRIVTITLRTYDYIECRNSDIESWVDFAGELDPLRYRVIFIPDASPDGVNTFKKINKFEIFDSACWNIELRAALYQRAWINMGVVCGPLAISCLMENVFTAMIDRTLDYPDDFRDGFRDSGIIPGKPLNFYSKSCKFYLGKDNKETILKLFNQFNANN